LLELDNANASLVIGAISTIVLYSSVACLLCSWRDYRQTQLADYGKEKKEKTEIPKFNTAPSRYLNKISDQYFLFSRLLIFMDIIIPIGFGFFVILATHKEFLGFLTKIPALILADWNGA
jgi:hypothetical protein